MGTLDDLKGAGPDGTNTILFTLRPLYNFLEPITRPTQAGRGGDYKKRASMWQEKVASLTSAKLEAVLAQVGSDDGLADALVPLARFFQPDSMVDTGHLCHQLCGIFLKAIKIVGQCCFVCLGDFEGHHGANVHMLDDVPRLPTHHAPSSLTMHPLNRAVLGWGDPTTDQGHRGWINCQVGHPDCNDLSGKGKRLPERGSRVEQKVSAAAAPTVGRVCQPVSLDMDCAGDLGASSGED
jgi:hypothetical protein